MDIKGNSGKGLRKERAVEKALTVSENTYMMMSRMLLEMTLKGLLVRSRKEHIIEHWREGCPRYKVTARGWIMFYSWKKNKTCNWWTSILAEEIP